MTKTVSVTGAFKDLKGRPLKGAIYFSPVPGYLVDQEGDTVYSGQVAAELDEEGNLDISLVPTVTGWKYSVKFNLKTQEDMNVPMQETFVSVPESSALPDVIYLSSDPGPANPLPAFQMNDDTGTASVTGATLNPDDPGSIIVVVN